jgi:general secretion pathway protein N
MNRRRVWGSIFAMLAIALTGVAFAPAAWLSDIVAARSRVRLIYPSGTFWDGSAILAIYDGRSARALPGRLAWNVRWWELVRGQLVVKINHPSLEDAIRIGYDGRAVYLERGRALWPAAMLEILGAPFNTISPGGLLLVRWDDSRLTKSGFSGGVQVDWSNAQSALSPVVPLGDFRVVVDLDEGEGSATLVTLKGPLLLKGEGRMERGHVQFSGTADAEPTMRAKLNGLIGVLGPRSGEKVLLHWEYRT